MAALWSARIDGRRLSAEEVVDQRGDVQCRGESVAVDVRPRGWTIGVVDIGTACSFRLHDLQPADHTKHGH